MHDRRPLGDSTEEMLRHVTRLWGYDVRLESVDAAGQVEHTASCALQPA